MIRRSNSLVGTQLNSVWLEGTLLNPPVDAAPPSDTCRFRLRVPLPGHQGEPSTLLVEASESAFDGPRPPLGRGQAVRIIGRLHQHRWSDPTGRLREEVKVIGEMVEPTEVKV